MNGSFRNDVRVEAVAEIDRVDVVTGSAGGISRHQGLNKIHAFPKGTCKHTACCGTYHSRSLYMIVKKTWRKRLTAFIRTASRYSHASPVIVAC